MKQTGPAVMLLALLLALSACGSGPAAEHTAISSAPTETTPPSQTIAPATSDPEGKSSLMNKITLSFNGHTYTATLADNPSAEAFAQLLKDGPLTVSARDYGNFEKVGSLGTELPRTDEQITTAPGDIIDEPSEIRIRVAGRAKTKAIADLVPNEVEALYTNGPAGGCGAVKRTRDIVSVASILVSRYDVKPEVEVFEV